MDPSSSLFDVDFGAEFEFFDDDFAASFDFDPKLEKQKTSQKYQGRNAIYQIIKDKCDAWYLCPQQW